jgi:MoxR-like ATPase
MNDDPNYRPKYRYQAIFDDREQPALRRRPPHVGTAEEVGDRAAGTVYVFDDEIRLAVNLALATGRPLLVSGPSGSGKSSLARAVADLAHWSYVEQTITSRLQARDLLYDIDHLKRLRDAQNGTLTDDERPYVVPGPLFWAFAPEAARTLLEGTGRGQSAPKGIRQGAERSVVLLDEIDKADPDVPNDLLIPFGQLAFEAVELGLKVACPASAVPLLILTTNGERDLPPAFLRRCVELQIKGAEDTPTGRAKLFAIVRKHGLDVTNEDLGPLADAFFAAPRPERREQNSAEFIDLVRAWRHLKLSTEPHAPTLDAVLAAITLGSGGSGL